MVMSEGVSIVVCCHNSALMLPKALTFVAEQKVRDGIEWEVIVVDNASTDETSQVALRSWPSKAPAPLRVVHESQLGLVYARIKGFAEANYGIVSFIDDDNWVYPDWVEVVWEVMNNDPKIGACGGLNDPVFETQPPWWFKSVEDSYAVGPQGQKAGKMTWSRGYLHGAGLSVRKSAWQELVRKGFQPKLVGRRGKTLTGGEDSELCLALRLAGWELWYEPRLRLHHFLPAHRLKWSYVRRVRRESGEYLVEQDPYHCALEENYENLIVRLRETWQWQTFATLVRLSWLVLSSFLTNPEGDHKLLRRERMIGRLIGLLKKRKVYDLSIREVRQAPWRCVLQNSTTPGSN
jgi:glycosyltransferase involved in cell wall biosynthesis